MQAAASHSNKLAPLNSAEQKAENVCFFNDFHNLLQNLLSFSISLPEFGSLTRQNIAETLNESFQFAMELDIFCEITRKITLLAFSNSSEMTEIQKKLFFCQNKYIFNAIASRVMNCNTEQCNLENFIAALKNEISTQKENLKNLILIREKIHHSFAEFELNDNVRMKLLEFIDEDVLDDCYAECINEHLSGDFQQLLCEKLAMILGPNQTLETFTASSLQHCMSIYGAFEEIFQSAASSALQRTCRRLCGVNLLAALQNFTAQNVDSPLVAHKIQLLLEGHKHFWQDKFGGIDVQQFNCITKQSHCQPNASANKK